MPYAEEVRKEMIKSNDIRRQRRVRTREIIVDTFLKYYVKWDKQESVSKEDLEMFKTDLVVNLKDDKRDNLINMFNFFVKKADNSSSLSADMKMKLLRIQLATIVFPYSIKYIKESSVTDDEYEEYIRMIYELFELYPNKDDLTELLNVVIDGEIIINEDKIISKVLSNNTIDFDAAKIITKTLTKVLKLYTNRFTDDDTHEITNDLFNDSMSEELREQISDLIDYAVNEFDNEYPPNQKEKWLKPALAKTVN